MPSYDPNNIFAKILRGEFPCHKVYEDDKAIAFLDIMPRAPGHTLVLPKAPARNLLDIAQADLAHVMQVAQKIAQAQMKVFGADTLFGRHWGAIEHHPFLHFEVCYYQAIAFAIERGLARVEAGAQGEHKLARGYLPTTTYSAHFIGDPALRRAIADYLKRERMYVAAAGDELIAAAPFRKDLTTEEAS